MGRPGKRHVLDPFRSTEMLCGLARVHHGHTAEAHNDRDRRLDAADVSKLERCSRCWHRAREIRQVVARAAELQTIEVACTFCGAQPGDLCMDTARRPRVGHMPRMTLARWRREEEFPDPRALAQRNQRQHELKLVLDEFAVQAPRSSDRPSAPMTTTPESASSSEADGA